MCVVSTTLIISLLPILSQSSTNFSLTVLQPPIIRHKFSQGLEYKTIIPGTLLTHFKTPITIIYDKNNESGCSKYKNSYQKKKQKHGVMILDRESCSLSTKIHFAQLAGFELVLMKYLDDRIDEIEVDSSDFRGVKVPVLMVKKSDGDIFQEIINSQSENKIVVSLEAQNQIVKNNKIQIFMSSVVLKNPIINFLKDLVSQKNIM